MKTIDIEEVKNAVAKKHSYMNWQMYEMDFRDGLHHDNLIDEAAIEYAKQCCDEQIKACAENAEAYMSNRGNPVVHKESILNTPNVVTIKTK